MADSAKPLQTSVSHNDCHPELLRHPRPATRTCQRSASGFKGARKIQYMRLVKNSIFFFFTEKLKEPLAGSVFPRDGKHPDHVCPAKQRTESAPRASSGGRPLSPDAAPSWAHNEHRREGGPGQGRRSLCAADRAPRLKGPFSVTTLPWGRRKADGHYDRTQKTWKVPGFRQKNQALPAPEFAMWNCRRRAHRRCSDICAGTRATPQARSARGVST